MIREAEMYDQNLSFLKILQSEVAELRMKNLALCNEMKNMKDNFATELQEENAALRRTVKAMNYNFAATLQREKEERDADVLAQKTLLKQYADENQELKQKCDGHEAMLNNLRLKMEKASQERDAMETCAQERNEYIEFIHARLKNVRGLYAQVMQDNNLILGQIQMLEHRLFGVEEKQLYRATVLTHAYSYM